jgi:hypothetical protein
MVYISIETIFRETCAHIFPMAVNYAISLMIQFIVARKLGK